MSDTWERLLHEVVAETLTRETGRCADLCGECESCRADALYLRYVAKCEAVGHLHVRVRNDGHGLLYSVDEIMAHAAEQTRVRREIGRRIRSITSA